MIPKIRRLQALLAELGEKNFTLTFGYELPATRLAIKEALGNIDITKKDIDVSFEPKDPLSLTFITYDEEWRTNVVATIKENEFAAATKKVPCTPHKAKCNPVGGQIDVTEDFLNKSIELLTEKVKKKFEGEILKELVEARLKERRLV